MFSKFGVGTFLKQNTIKWLHENANNPVTESKREVKESQKSVGYAWREVECL